MALEYFPTTFTPLANEGCSTALTALTALTTPFA